MIFRALIVFLVFSINSSLTSQNTYRNYIDTLSSPSFMGRGYVKEGHLIAAKFIKNKYIEIGLSPLDSKSYFQEFPIRVNTFPDSVTVIKDGYKLKEGIDFLIDPSSKSLKGKFSAININVKNFKTVLKDIQLDNSSNIFVLDISKVTNKDSISFYNELKMELSKISPVIFIQNQKLTWSVSDRQTNFPVILMNKGMSCENQSVFDIDINAELKLFKTNNICGKVKGKKDKYVVISAHYDHLGMMGNALFPGANDNASGVSLLLNLAKHYSKKTNKYKMVFICFGAEEVGLLGSKYFTDNPLIELKKIKFLINLDIVGTGEEGIAIVNAINQPKQSKRIGKFNTQMNLFSKIKIRGQAPNSDHYWFSKKEVPAVFIYTLGGIKAYHDIFDKSETLPISKINDLYLLISKFLEGS